MMIDYKHDVERKNNFTINHKAISKLVVYRVEEIMQEQKNNKYNESSVKKYKCIK